MYSCKPRLLDINNKLSPDAQEITAAYAVAYPERPARTKVIGWINSARKYRGLRGIKPDEARIAIDEAVAAGVLAASVEGHRGVAAKGPSALPGTITRFCEIAVNLDLGRVVLDSLTGSYGYSFNYQNVASGQRLRHAVICDEQGLDEYVQPKPAGWIWLLEPRAEKYLNRLPVDFRQQACAVCLNFAVESFMPTKVFLATCKTSAPNFAELMPIASLGFILEGQFEQARQCFTDLPLADRKSKTVVVASLATDALIAVLQGDDALAHKKIFACIEAEKIGTRKRKVYPEYTIFTLALLSLFRTSTPEGGALLRSLRSMGKSSHQAARFDWLMELAESAQLPHTGYRGLDVLAPCLDTLLTVITSQWHSEFALRPAKGNIDRLCELFNLAQAGGYSWVAAEALTVLESIGKAESLDRKSVKAGGEQRHQQLGTQTLTDLVRTLEPWEMSLQTLESLIPKTTPVKKTKEQSVDQKKSRLIWQVITWGQFGDLDISPLEQRLGKTGKWTAGRAVSLKRLNEKAAEMPFLIDQDKKAASAIESWSAGWGSSAREYEVGARAVYHLVGHPYVFNKQDEKIEVVEKIASLQIDTRSDHLTMKLAPTPTGSRNYQMKLDTGSRQIEVTHFTAAQMRISDALLDEIKVPLAQKQRLQDVVSALASDISVQSDAQDTATELHQGDSQPLLQLEYSGDVLGIRVQVEPLAESDQFFDAGEGGQVVYVNTVSGSVQVARDLSLEREQLQALVSSSSSLAGVYDGRPTMQLDGTESVLELLDELQELQVRCLWPRDIPLKVTARAASNQLNLSIKSADEWFSASGELNYSPQDSLSLSRLLQLLDQSPQSRFIELAKGEFLALSATLQQQLQALQTYGGAQSGRDGEHRLHAMSALALEPLLDSASITADKHWKNWRQRLQRSSTLESKVPETLQAELRPYQLDGYQWLTRIAELGAGACLADDMGLGKTLQALALLLQRAPDGAALVVAPTSVTGNWLQEVRRFAPTLKVGLYGGAAQERKAVLQKLQAFDLVIVTYGLLHNDIDKLSAVHWHTVVLDEAQAIKNATTQRAKAVRKLNADFRLATTGTPIQNNLMDLHSLFAFLIPGFLGSNAKYRNTFALPIERDNNDDARQQLRSLVSPFMLRRHKRDVLKDLPARTDITLSVELSGDEAALYEALRQQALEAVHKSAEDAGDGTRKLRVLAELMRLRRLCCNPQLIHSDWSGPMAKLALFASTVDELLANQHKVLVFSQFVDHLKILEAHLLEQGISYQYLDGSTTAKQRTERVSAFQSGQGDVFLISLTAGGTGLNLTAADYVIHMDPWWNPAVEDQASDRAHRIGQQRPVTIYRMVTAGTIEAQIQELHSTKRELADSLLSDTDSTRFDLKELLSMLQTPVISNDQESAR